MKFVILGGYGEIGQVIVEDLFETAKNAEIIIAGRDAARAKKFAGSFKNPRVTSRQADAGNIKKLSKLLKGTDMCINAAQYYYNLNVMRACLIAKTNYVDLGGLFHMTKKQLKLNSLFIKRGLTAALGCGATPGITNIMIAKASQFFDAIYEVHIRFGGKDYTNYNQPFTLPYSAQTILDEFSMKAAIFNKKIKMIKPFSDEEIENFSQPVGKTRCGSILHSELATIPQFLRNKKLRICTFKGGFGEEFSQFFLLLTRLGFHKGVARILTINFLNQFLPAPNTKVRDLEILRVRITGKRKNKKQTLVMECTASSNSKWNAAAGTVDTAVPCSIIAQMIANNQITEKGALPPEKCVPPEKFFKQLKKRGMKIRIF